MTTFASLGITPPILQALTDYGYETPTVIQEKAIPAGIAGRDVLGSAQTGTGKTCAFGVPILQRLAKAGKKKGIRALILTPTRELAIQIDDNLQAYGKNLPLTELVIFGGVGQAPQVEGLKQGVDILTATPGRLLDLAGQGLLSLKDVEIFVLDEADRMLDMGFIHDVRKVIALLPEKKQTMFFSATLPPEIMDLVNKLLHDPVRASAAPVSSPVEVIRQEVCLVDRGNKTALLLEIMQQEQVKNALVFTRTKHGADKVARDLTRQGVPAAAIHGNKSQTARQESLRKFKAGEIPVLVATDIAARGLDIEELAYVFNYNLSEVPETYIHRIGRTGRAGRGGTAISFCDYGEMPMLRDIETLLKKPIPRREHPYPMQVFEAPKKDARGRIINPEDDEARKAAREKHAERKKAQKTAAAAVAAEASHRKTGSEQQSALPQKEDSGKGKARKNRSAEKAALKAAPQTAPKPTPQPAPKEEKKRPTYPHGKQNLGNLEDYLAAQPVEEPVLTFRHRNPLEGDVIMDATARLLAAKPVYQYHKPKAPERSGGKSRTKPRAELPLKEKSPEKQAQPARKGKAASKQGNPAPKPGAGKAEQQPALEKPIPAPKARPEKSVAKPEKTGKTASAARKQVAADPKGTKRGGKSRHNPARPEPAQNRQKDSTEQSSLMKPFYINHD